MGGKRLRQTYRAFGDDPDALCQRCANFQLQQMCLVFLIQCLRRRDFAFTTGDVFTQRFVLGDV